MKKCFSIALYSVLFATSALFAENELRIRNLENRIEKLENNKTDRRFIDPITPNAGPKVTDGMDMYITADFIYWAARVDGFCYAKSGMTNDTIPVTSKGKVHTIDWSYDPGFKTGFGWTFDHGGWDLYLQYTWFYTSASEKTNSSNLETGFAILPPAFAVTPLSAELASAKAHWNLHYQIGDLELGRNYYVNRYLKLRPFIGIKGTWQKQRFHVFEQTQGFFFEFEDITSKQKQSLWGLGMRAGLNTSWQFNKWLSLYGNFSLSGVWLNYNITRKDLLLIIQDEDEENPFTLPVTTANLDAKAHMVKPVLEFAMGFRAESYFASNRLHILLQAGWESQIWLNQTLFISITNYYDRFDLNLHGLTARLRFDF